MFQLALARMREFSREPEAVFWVFGFPIVLAFALGLAFRNSGPGELQVGVASGPNDRSVAATLDSSPHLAATVPDNASVFYTILGGPDWLNGKPRNNLVSGSFAQTHPHPAHVRHAYRPVSRL